jgi:hypothetical protein|tara:strand:+ start:183 stop:674 length:492 start_codon:yes stop_codon:yes gene_type:complete
MKYEEPTINPFDAPIPGQSLTDTPGNYPWEHPPKYSDFMEASTFIWNRLHQKESNKKILTLMQMGVPIESLTRTTLFGGFVNGLWNPDLAIMLAPTVAKMYISIAQVANLKDITLDLPRKKMKNLVGEIMALKNTSSKKMESKTKKFEDDVVKGLMSRKSEEE